jgi:hypothetical protein
MAFTCINIPCPPIADAISVGMLFVEIIVELYLLLYLLGERR